MIIDFHSHQPQPQTQKEKADVHLYCHADFREPLSIGLGVKLCVGLHPWYLPSTWELGKAYLEEASKHPQFLTLGECGLDRVKGADWAWQLELLSHQLAWAATKQLPFVVLHSVKANPECWSAIQHSNFRGKVVFHDYLGNLDFTQKMLKEKRVYFSLGHALEGRGKFHQVIEQLPQKEWLSKVLLETDEAKVSIHERYAQASALLGVPSKDLIKRIALNFKELTSSAF